MNVQRNTETGPDYDVQIDADDLKRELAEKAAEHMHVAAEHRRDHRELCNPFQREPGDLCQFQRWALEEVAAARAYANAIRRLQPRPDRSYTPKDVTDGTVDVRSFLRWVKHRIEETNDRRHGDYQASAAHGAYAHIDGLVRDEFGVGQPRLDNLSGTPIKEDLP